MPMFRRRQPRDQDAFAAEVLAYLEPLYATAAHSVDTSQLGLEGAVARIAGLFAS